MEIFGLQQTMVWLITFLWLFILQKPLEAEQVHGLAIGHAQEETEAPELGTNAPSSSSGVGQDENQKATPVSIQVR